MIRIARLVGIVVLMLAAGLGPGRPALAADPIVLPAGLGCSFELQIDIVGAPQVEKEFTDKNGNVVRTLSAGKGSTLTFTNTATDATLTLKTKGSVSQTTPNPDGSSTVMNTGHNVIILFPTDVPAGPSTTLYVGKVVYTVDQFGVFTIQEVNGQTTDICTALS